MSVEDVMQIVKRDTTFYGTSGGGVTLSGGEALVQWEFARAIAHRLQMMMIDVAIETTGYAKWEHAWSVYQYCDRILYDMKVMDSDKHLQYTGVRNELILENAARLAKTGKKVIYRVPLIEGVNNDDQNILQLCALAKENHVSEIHLLPYHEYGKPKYTALNREYTFAASTPTDENIQHLTELIASQGIRCVKGGE